jgi:cytochrome c oxidase assembly protein subunit 11
MAAALADRNRRTGFYALTVVAAMVALGFASVPLYRMFCQATGFNGTTQRSTTGEAPGTTGLIISVRFDANTAPGMGWSFTPEQETERVAVGAREMAFFNATNNTSHPITGSATFNVTPTQSGQYFTKIQCFCFTEQTLQPGETVRMPVVYYVDPAFATDKDTKDIPEITLSYTFYPVDQSKSRG